MYILLLLLTQLLAATNAVEGAAITLYWVPWPRHGTNSVPPPATASFTPVGTGTDGTTYVGQVVETAVVYVSADIDTDRQLTTTVVTETFPSATETVTIVQDASHFSQNLVQGIDDTFSQRVNRSCTIGSDAVVTCAFVDYISNAPDRVQTLTGTYTDSAIPFYTLVTNGEKGVRSGWDALLFGLVVSFGISLGAIITML